MRSDLYIKIINYIEIKMNFKIEEGVRSYIFLLFLSWEFNLLLFSNDCFFVSMIYGYMYSFLYY